MTGVTADAISALMCMTVAAVLAPLSKSIYDQGAPWGLCAVFYAVALAALLAMLYFLWQIARPGLRGNGKRRKVSTRSRKVTVR